MRAVSAADSPIGGMPGGQGWPPRAGSGAVAGVDLQVSGAGGGLADGGRGVAGGGRCGGEDVSAGERGLDGGGPQLGEGGQRGVPADRVPGAGLGLVPAEGILSGFESYFYWPAAACDGDEVGHGRGPAFRCPAQVERVLVLVPVREAADQQELPRVRGGDQRPVAVAGAFRPVPARPPLEHGVGDRLVSADDPVRREGDLVIAGDDDDVGQRQRPAARPGTRRSGRTPRRRRPTAPRSPAAISRFTCAMASSGFVANASFSGIPAFARRGGSFAQQSGMYTSKSAQACPSAVTRAANTQGRVGRPARSRVHSG